MVREKLQFVTASHMDTVMETAIDFTRRPRKRKKSSRGSVAHQTDTTATAVMQ